MRLGLCQDQLAQLCLSGLTLSYKSFNLAAFSLGVSFVVRRLLGVLAMIDDDATDWKVQQVVM